MQWDELDQQPCSVARTLSVIGDRWTLLILRDCFMKVRRFDDFQARLGIGRWIAGYNTTRPHQALGYRTPDEVYRSPPVAGPAPTPIDVAA